MEETGMYQLECIKTIVLAPGASLDTRLKGFLIPVGKMSKYEVSPQ